MNFFSPCTRFLLICLFFTACKSNSNKQDLPRSTRGILTATELIELSACTDLLCVQLFMRDRSNDFFGSFKGDFTSFYRTAVTDTAGNSLGIAMSTLYVTVNAGEDWSMAHTVHTKALSDQLLQEFAVVKFMLTDSVYSNKSAGFKYHYSSAQYPGLVLSQTKTIVPWRRRGLYTTVTWPCYVFELITAE